MHVSTVSRVLNGRTRCGRPAGDPAAHREARRLRYRPNAMRAGLKPSQHRSAWDCWCRRCETRCTPRSSAAPSIAPGSASFVVLLAEDTGGTSAQQAYESLVRRGSDRRTADRQRPSRQPALLTHFAEKIPCRACSSTAAISAAVATPRCARRMPAGWWPGTCSNSAIAGWRTWPARTELDTASRRLQGFVEGRRARPAIAAGGGGRLRRAGGMAAMSRLLARRVPPTGVFVSNINQAVGAIAAARIGRPCRSPMTSRWSATTTTPCATA